ncbi:GntR family transcriptional regulator [Mesorhizobium sp. L-8-10]|uniref:GntR family transcriptional regulator n=1 Tax=Mesorhizobium sp. L-8-10 TaxID=2744523 RepID=UPI0019264F2A|nr:GntR family transcriptional regulator [Mesorhizobium sp. L-8-10]
MTDTQDELPQLMSHQSFREQAREVIRGMIVSGKMAPDALYSAPKIASDLNVSATPVREALLDLVQEGLLRPVRNRGFQVVIMTAKEHDDVFKIRLLLEVPSIREISKSSPTANQMKGLYDLANAARQFAREGDLIAYLNADRRFHISLIELLGNKPLTELVASLRDRVRLLGLANSGARSHIVQSATEHFELLDRIAASDTESAAAIIERHLRRSRDVWGAGSGPA